MKALYFWIFSLFAISSGFSEKIQVLYLTYYDDPQTTIAIHWQTKSEKTSFFYKKEGADSWTEEHIEDTRIESIPITNHRVHLQNLSPNTAYTFQIDEEMYSFRTLSDQTPIRFVISGDAYGFLKPYVQMCKTIAEQNPQFVVVGGDIAYTAKIPHPFTTKKTAAKRWITFFEVWKEHMVTKEGYLIPFVFTLGNHDIDDQSSSLFFSLFHFSKPIIYRTLDIGNTLSLFLLDTGYLSSIDQEQCSWLKNQLIEKRGTLYKFPIYHEAAYPSVRSFNHPTSELVRKYWSPLFEKYGVQAAFEHDNHAFKRTHPIIQEKIDSKGPVYLGDGCWGVTPRKQKNHELLKKTARLQHFFLIDISSKGCFVKAVDKKGKVFDEIEILPDQSAATSEGSGS